MSSKVLAVGTVKTNPNGYKRVKTDGGWRFIHHVVIEEKLGRPIGAGERVVFKDGDRSNCSPDNLEVRVVGKRSPGRRRAILEAKLAEIQAELDALDDEEAS